MKLARKTHFRFGKMKQCAKLYLRRTFSNVFITLTDMGSRVIVCKTSGNSGIIGSKRRKKAPNAVEVIVKKLVPYLKLYKIIRVYMILKMKISSFFYILKKELAFLNIKIVKLRMKRPISFSTVRGRKCRRV